MFFSRTKLLSDEEFETLKYSVLKNTLGKLKNHWPTMAEEVIAAADRQYASDRIGNILVAQIELLIDAIKKEHQEQRSTESSRHWESEGALRKELTTLKETNNILELKMKRLEASNKEIQGKLNAQNDLIASLYEQIQSLTGNTF